MPSSCPARTAALATLLLLAALVGAGAEPATEAPAVAAPAAAAPAPATPAPATPGVALTPGQAAIADLSVAARLTVADEQCRLPVVVNGTLVADCFAWPAAPAGACFTSASPTIPQRCAPKAAAPPTALASLLKSGGGADALPGSLCTIGGGRVAAKIIAPAAESAKLPACGEDSGWGCAVLQPKGPLKEAGFGYCQALDGSEPALAGAGAPTGSGLAAPVAVPARGPPQAA